MRAFQFTYRVIIAAKKKTVDINNMNHLHPVGFHYLLSSDNTAKRLIWPLSDRKYQRFWFSSLQSEGRMIFQNGCDYIRQGKVQE
jgi:hypothetical protein